MKRIPDYADDYNFTSTLKSIIDECILTRKLDVYSDEEIYETILNMKRDEILWINIENAVIKSFENNH